MVLLDWLARWTVSWFVQPLFDSWVAFVLNMVLLRLRVEFRLGFRLQRLRVFGVLALLLATPDTAVARSQSTSLTSSSLLDFDVAMNPDATSFNPKPEDDTGLQASSFKLNIDNVTDRSGKLPRPKPFNMDEDDVETSLPDDSDDVGGGLGVPGGGSSSGDGVQADVLVGSFLEALKKMMKSNHSDSESDDESIPAGTVLSSGITLPTGFPRSKDSFVSSRVQISRHNRGKTVEARRKLRDWVCVKLDHMLKLTKWDEILDSRTDSDLGTAVASPSKLRLTVSLSSV
jgi:hypothetical protein